MRPYRRGIGVDVCRLRVFPAKGERKYGVFFGFSFFFIVSVSSH